MHGADRPRLRARGRLPLAEIQLRVGETVKSALKRLLRSTLVDGRFSWPGAFVTALLGSDPGHLCRRGHRSAIHLPRLPECALRLAEPTVYLGN